MARREVTGGQVRDIGVTLPYLQAWRQRQLKTQKELAEAADVSRSTIASAERGSRIAVRTAEQIAGALGATIDDLQHAPKGNG
jgi:transcriptional regulator with XRE-family HTH domain